MTNTTFRRRALLSSVAMMLVALIALGSATFAWFTTAPNTSTTGLKVNTSTSAGLVARSYSVSQITGIESEDNKGWQHDTAFDATAIASTSGTGPSQVHTFTTSSASHPLSPLTTDLAATPGSDSLTFYSANATAVTGYQAATEAGTGNPAWGSAITDGTGTVAEKIYLRTSLDSADTSITLQTAKVTINTVSAQPASSAVRVALVAADASGASTSYSLIGVWAPSTTTTNGYRSSTGAIASTTAFKASTESVTSLNIGVKNDGSTYVNVIVYLDGQDTNCYTNAITSAEELISGITVELNA